MCCVASMFGLQVVSAIVQYFNCSMLASQIAERLFAYVRGAILDKRTAHPASALLSFSAV
jgi:hypothetical protein